MGQPAQHNVGKAVSLVFDGFGQHRMLIAVNHTPPGGNGVDKLLVFGVEINPVRIDNFIRLLHRFHLFIRIPYHRFSSPCILYNALNSSASMSSS